MARPPKSRRRASVRPQRSRAALALAAAGGTVLVCAGLLLWLLPAGGGAARIGGPFSLVADDGRPITEHSFPGKYLLVYFGYTTCRDVCPETLNNLAAALPRLGAKAASVQPLFITVDPARDTPAALHRYVRAFGPTLIGLTGPPGELQKIARAYRVVSIPRQDPGAPASTAIDHSSVLYLMAPDGSFAAPIPAAASEMVMAQALARRIPEPAP
jgi:protein SCO1/2